MCHVSKDTTSAATATALVVSKAISASPVPSNVMGTDRLTLSKSNTRLSPFRKIAKSARINLNRYWGLLSQKEQGVTKTQRKGSVSSSISNVSSTSMSVDYDYSAEEEENRINELLEAQANAEEQNSINSQIEYDSSPEPPRRMFVRQRALASSSYSSFSSSSSSVSGHYQYHYHNQPQRQLPYQCNFDDNVSQDSVFY